MEVNMDNRGIQDYYADRFSHCYGCGRLNRQGLQLKTTWEGDETVTRFSPEAFHTALPGFVYGGLLASLIDCHGTGSSALAYVRSNRITLKGFNAPRFVTVSLKVDYKRPTPLGTELVIRGKIKEITKRKVIVEAVLLAGNDICVSGEIISVLVPEDFGSTPSGRE
jgi:acyl-coenzyme A thioesterase PaaI-like protein